jgi:hypothetical protein
MINRFHCRDARKVQHIQNNKCNETHKQNAGPKKVTLSPQKMHQTFQQISKSFHDKTSEETRNRKKIHRIYLGS